MARRKVNINTFNPNAGVSIPGWAVESYKDTVDTGQDIVGDITKEVDRSRKDNMQFALESSKIAQRQREFEYKKDQDEYNIGRQNFIDSTSDFGNSPDDLDALEAILNNLPATGNQNLSDFYQSQRENVKRTRKVNAGIKENIRNFMLGGLDDASLKETGRDVFLDSWTMQAIKDPTGWNKNQTEYMFKQAFPQYNPDFLQSEIFKNGARAANDIFALAIMQEPGSKEAEEYFNKFNSAIEQLGGQTGAVKGDIDFDMSSDFLMQYAKDSGQDLADVNLRAGQDKDGLMTEINTFYSKPEDEEAGMIEGITDYINELFSSEPKEASGPVTISYRGKEAIAIPGSEKTDSAGNLSYELEYEDGSRERVDAKGVSDQLPEDFQQSSVSEPGIIDRTMQGIGTIGRFLSRDDADLATESGKFVGEIVKSPAVIYEAGSNFATDLLTITPEEQKSITKVANSVNNFTQAIKSSFKETYPTVDAVLAQVPRVVGAKPTEEQDAIFSSAINEIASDMKVVGVFAMNELTKGFKSKPEQTPSFEMNLAAKSMTKKSKEDYNNFVKSGGKKIVSKEVQKQIASLKKMRKKISSTPNYENKKGMISEIDKLIDRASRIRASKTAQDLFDEFNVGAQFDFDLGLEVDTQITKALRELEVEDLIRQQSPNTTSTKEDVEYFELMNSLGRN